MGRLLRQSRNERRGQGSADCGTQGVMLMGVAMGDRSARRKILDISVVLSGVRLRPQISFRHEPENSGCGRSSRTSRQAKTGRRTAIGAARFGRRKTGPAPAAALLTCGCTHAEVRNAHQKSGRRPADHKGSQFAEFRAHIFRKICQRGCWRGSNRLVPRKPAAGDPWDVVEHISEMFAQQANVADRDLFSEVIKGALRAWVSAILHPKTSPPLLRQMRQNAMELQKCLAVLEAGQLPAIVNALGPWGHLFT